MKTKLQFVIRHSSFAIALALCAVAQISSAATASFNYQGILKNEAGTQALTGNKTVEIRLYNTETGGTAVWGRTYSVLLDANGLFNVEVSDTTGSAIVSGTTLETVFADNASSTLYIGLKVSGSSGEILPRQKLLAVPYATFASDVTQAKSDFTVTGTLTAKKLTLTDSLSAASVSVSGGIGGATLTTSSDATVKGNLTVNGTLNGIGLVPVNGIIMWSGSTVPSGWALCDGTQGTPDLRGRFIVGAGNGSGYSVGSIGGENFHRLTVDEMPSHKHSVYARSLGYEGHRISDNEVLAGKYQYMANGSVYVNDTEYTGGNSSHENRPPYYALAFIMRLK